MILNPCVMVSSMVDEKECKICTKDCRFAGRPTTIEKLNTATYGIDRPVDYVPNKNIK